MSDLLYTGTDYIAISENPDNPYIQHEAFLNKMQCKKVASFLETINVPVPKCLIVGEPTSLKDLEQDMKTVLNGKMNVFRSEPFFLELVPNEIDKATPAIEPMPIVPDRAVAKA